jgi:hypothetical protein
MPLSRLQNFLKSVRGNILYVNPNDLDATDSIENQGNSLTRPFKTIQRALVEASRFSYQTGLSNDRFAQTTVLLYPGEHVVDNRPGFIANDAGGGSAEYTSRGGTTGLSISPFDLTSNFDLESSSNVLYKLNSIHGGVIVPRGTSIVGYDLRKTKLRPKYVPDPENSNIENSAIFRVTGGCYFWQFSIFDASPSGQGYKDYTDNTFLPNFSHHKLTCFEFADGVNNIAVKDSFLNVSKSFSDLDNYYYKISDVYDNASGRAIAPDYPSGNVDIEPIIDETRIVGPKGGSVGITSIRSGNGVTGNTTITVETSTALSGITVDMPLRIIGVTASGYDGQRTVKSVGSGSTTFTYEVDTVPSTLFETPSNAKAELQVDTVSSASPYVFNCSLLSVYGMGGLHADGNKATGFKSMVAAQFTGISLQKDVKAFVKYNTSSGVYDDSTTVDNIAADSLARYKPAYSNYHIRCSNDAVLQIVSCFGVGFNGHFLAESGGDQSITNSNSNFGGAALVSDGYKEDAFSRDDVGYITHIIPPKEITTSDSALEFVSLDVSKTLSVGNTSRLYLYDQTNADVKPETVIQGFRLGAKTDDKLKVLIPLSGTTTEYSARIIMHNTAYASDEPSSVKRFTLNRSSVGINSITNSILTLTKVHNFLSGESVRVISESGHLPDGIDEKLTYNVIDANIDSSLATNQIKLAQNETDALADNFATLNNKGGILTIESRVSDKLAGDAGHPVQYDSGQNQWYVNVATAATENNIYSTVIGYSTAIGSNTPRTYISRKSDDRSQQDTLFRARYVVPAGVSSARPPIDGYVMQESCGDIETTANIQLVTLTNSVQQRNQTFIADANYLAATGIATITTEKPHNLEVGAQVQMLNVVSANNTTGIGTSGYNFKATVSGINSDRSFSVALDDDPGAFQNDTSTRTVDLPYYKKKDYATNFYVYRSTEIKKHVKDQQDGVYHLTLLNASNAPNITPFSGQNFSQNIIDLYPQTDRDNINSDPDSARSFATPDDIGEVLTNDLKKSITKENIIRFGRDSKVGIGVTDICSDIVVGTSHTIYTDRDHGLFGIKSVGLGSTGFGYGSGAAGTLYNATLTAVGSSTVGKSATAEITVDGIGGITSVRITNPGSAFGIGNTLAVTGTATTTSHVQGWVTVLTTFDNTNDSLSVLGVTSNTYSSRNTQYQVSGYEIGESKKIQVSTASSMTGIGAASTMGIGATVCARAMVFNAGPGIGITYFSYDYLSGIATVGSGVTAHGLSVGNVLSFVGSSNTAYNGDFRVTQVVGLTTFKVNAGVGTESPSESAGGSFYALPRGYASNDGAISLENENLSSRMTPILSGISTTLNSAVTTKTATSVEITNSFNSGLQKGNYIQIDEEIMRVATTPVGGSDAVTVLRGQLGTRRATHIDGSVIRVVSPIATEFRRNSILRASGHTFEYVGFGPGNYSTSLPEKVDRVLTGKQELLAQSVKKGGGVNVYTGMNDKGNFYVGNKKVNSTTGQEEVVDAPIATVTGEDLDIASGVAVGLDVITPLEVTVSRSLKVEGGTDANIISEFDGPVLFNKKVTSLGAGGIEANTFFIQGNATVAREVSVGISTPTVNGNPGDIKFFSDPKSGGSVGWVFTVENAWRRFGRISLYDFKDTNIFDQVGIATTTPNNYELQIGAGSSIINASAGKLGVGVTTPVRKLDVYGDVGATGFVTAGTYVYGDGSRLTNLPSDSQWTRTDAGINTISTNAGIGTTNPAYSLDIRGGKSGNSGQLYVGGDSQFTGVATMANVQATTLSATDVLIIDSDGQADVGIVTVRDYFNVGVGGTVIFTNSAGKVGINSATIDNQAAVDIGGRVRLDDYYEKVTTVTSSSGVVTLDLAKSRTFNLTTSEAVTQFVLSNRLDSDDHTTFTLKINQGSSAYAVGINTFKQTSGGTAIPISWSGGVVPSVVNVGLKTDIYSFQTFDGGASLYGIVVGQNFS